LVCAGMDSATGESLRTIETVAGERSRKSAGILSVAGLPVSVGLIRLAVIVVRREGCSTYGNSCTPSAGAPNGVPFEIGNFPFRAADLKFTKLRQIRSLPVTSFDTCPNKLLLLRFLTSCVYRVSFAEHEQFIEGD